MAKKPKKKSKWANEPAPCPQCKLMLDRDLDVFNGHFQAQHGRLPTKGEEVQFRSYRPTKTPRAETDFQKPSNEVPGGGFSPR